MRAGQSRCVPAVEVIVAPDGQPPITPGAGVFSSDWLPGPADGTRSSVVVSFTDFRATVDEDLSEISRTGIELGQNWPIMSGAVGLWLWGKPNELRGGSVSVWQTDDDLRRFVRWPVHAEIVKAWRARIEVCAHRWAAPGFVAEDAWLRAEQYMQVPREMPQPVFVAEASAPTRRSW